SESLQSPDHNRVIGRLRALRARGVRLRYVEGNRDYFIGNAFEPDPFEEVAPDSLWVTLGGERIRFEHGDQINNRDRNYQRWRRLSRRPWLQGSFRALPSRFAGRVARWLERCVCTTHVVHGVGFPEDLCRARARDVFAEGARRLFLGHFHRLWEWEDSSRGEVCRAVVVPAWQQVRAGWIYEPQAGVDRLSGARRGGSNRP
ncbi:MAG: hypothetical protein V3U98_08835, partial [Acidobacteriota bacterium]